ncbi:hypothetical protein [Zavarzinia sp. CC-PAN008]|uniref:hypothetical protein n=1 Tax=Zavarzinia sp. CC-PAN008 TaxID=3243332 RepID=UPI003F749F7C
MRLSRRSFLCVAAAAPLAAPRAAQAFSEMTIASPLASVGEREGYLSWQRLAAAQDLAALDGAQVLLEGFVLPDYAVPDGRRLILSGVEGHCLSCFPGGLRGVVDVVASGAAIPVQAGRPLKVTGRFRLLANDPEMLFYRVEDARAV